MNAKLNLLIAGLLSVAAHPELNRASAQTPEYIVIDLGTLGGDESWAFGINSIGQVVGKSQFSPNSDIVHAFLYSNGSMKDLGTLGGDSSGAAAINNNGQVVGTSKINGNKYHHAFIYSNESMKNLDILGDKWSRASAINNNGQVVGEFTVNREPTGGYYYIHAFLYSNGSMQDLGTLGGRESYAYGINDHNQIIGRSQIAGGEKRAFLYSNGSMQDLGTLGGRESYAYAINDRGQVVGASQFKPASYYLHAFIYSNGHMKDLGTLKSRESYALGINDNGQVVGILWSYLSFNSHYKSAFLYSNGSMRDLNNLIDPTSKWTLVEARAINNAGQIVGTGTNPAGQTHAFLLNPLPSGWRKVIAETTPPQPTYSDGPEKLPGKDSLVVVTHGWIPAWKPIDIDWVVEMTNSITRYLENRGLNNWQVHAHKWVEKARPPTIFLVGGAEIALRNAKTEGIQLGRSIASKKLSHVHLIGHSAGAGLVQAASETIKTASLNTTIHLTFLDAFVGFDDEERGNYGKGADWTDSYFTHDIGTGDESLALTEGPLEYAHNVEVTWLDSRKKPVTVSYSTPSGDVSQTCYQTVSSHEWPHEFYQRTLSLSWQEAEGFGFPLSKEMGNWDNLAPLFPVGNEQARVLGNSELSCFITETKLTVSAIAKPNFTTAEIIKSTTGTVIIHGVDFFSLKTSSPVWLAVPTVITNRVNFVSFGAAFIDTNKAEGLLSVYWNTNTIGSIDERVSVSGLREYGFPLPITSTNSVGILGFRLDAFSATASSVLITNVTLGFNGLREPFALSVTDARVNDSPVLQLNGPAGFNYTVESSTNLVGWETIAVLVNTNGTVRFTVPSITNATTRFYRAVAH